MKDWIPLPGSAKGRLALAALHEFGARGFEQVSVVELATKAGVTTGSLYHHFDGKPGLYRVARHEAERRVIDRMEGAAAARTGDLVETILQWVLVVGFDAAAEQGLAALLAETPEKDDPIEAFFTPLLPDQAGPIASRVVSAAWRAALAAAAEGVPVEHARQALISLRFS